MSFVDIKGTKISTKISFRSIIHFDRNLKSMGSVSLIKFLCDYADISSPYRLAQEFGEFNVKKTFERALISAENSEIVHFRTNHLKENFEIEFVGFTRLDASQIVAYAKGRKCFFTVSEHYTYKHNITLGQFRFAPCVIGKVGKIIQYFPIPVISVHFLNIHNLRQWLDNRGELWRIMDSQAVLDLARRPAVVSNNAHKRVDQNDQNDKTSSTAVVTVSNSASSNLLSSPKLILEFKNMKLEITEK